jgi:hypothetical protein
MASNTATATFIRTLLEFDARSQMLLPILPGKRLLEPRSLAETMLSSSDRSCELGGGPSRK